MSREIKFRGFNTITKTMIDLKACTPLALDSKLETDGLFLPFTDEIILEQYTGLLDKNGTDLNWYQGDMLAIGGEVEVEIVWSEHYGQWYAKYVNTIMKGKLLNPVAVYAKNPLVKIIGTIHDTEQS